MAYVNIKSLNINDKLEATIYVRRCTLTETLIIKIFKMRRVVVLRECVRLLVEKMIANGKLRGFHLRELATFRELRYTQP